jgi:hypothetical protein
VKPEVRESVGLTLCFGVHLVKDFAVDNKLCALFRILVTE